MDAETRERLVNEFFEAAINGEDDEVEDLLDAGAEADSVDGSGRTALMKAASQGHIAIITLLLGRGAKHSLRDRGGADALLWCCECPEYADGVEVAQALHEAGAPLDGVDLEGVAPLMRAATVGHEALATWLLAEGADSTRCDAAGRNAVALALHAGHISLARQLVDEGAACDIASACALGDVDRASKLLADPAVAAAIDAADGTSGCTALMVASAEGERSVVELLLKHSASAAVRDAEGSGALLWACEFGHVEVVEALVFSSAYATVDDEVDAEGRRTRAAPLPPGPPPHSVVR
jgi:ankyrin repeat protein